MSENSHKGCSDTHFKIRLFSTLFPLLLFCGFSIFITGCSLNAPRDNPLDPELGGNIYGRVLSRNSYGIADVEISIPQADVITYTDAHGDFGLYVLPEGRMWVFFTHDNYSSESTMVVTKEGKLDTLMIYLNGLPYFINCEVTTHHYDEHLPAEPLYFCRLSTVASDIDGEIDIDSVWVEIPALFYAKRLIYDSFKREFNYILLAEELPGQNLETLVGKNIFFNIADKDSTVVQSSPYYVSRIIHQLPKVIFPSGGADILTTDTTFIWHKYNNGFYVRYYGEIARTSEGEPVVYEFNILEQNDTTYSLDISVLNEGEYIWTLEIIDSLGNSARNRKQKFYRE